MDNQQGFMKIYIKKGQAIFGLRTKGCPQKEKTGYFMTSSKIHKRPTPYQIMTNYIMTFKSFLGTYPPACNYDNRQKKDCWSMTLS